MDIKRILVVEDDRALAAGVRFALQPDGTEVALCPDLRSARAAWESAGADLVLLDIRLPDGSGLDFLRLIKKEGKTPVILLTANDTEADIVAGLESGADDYITKPFSLAVLRARVRARIREAEGGQERFFIGPFAFDFARMVFEKDGKPVELSKTEQKILRLLLENRGQKLARADLVDRVWTDGAVYVDENALSVAIKRLRDKLEDEPAHPKYIKTAYGIGYLWAVD